MGASRRVSAKAAGMAGGIFLGVYMFFATLFAMNGMEFYGFSNQYFGLLTSVFPGVTASVSGLFIGTLWGFVHGFLLAGIFAWLYDWALNKWG